MHSMIPGIIVDYYDGKKGNVRPLVDVRYVDGSYLTPAIIEDVPIYTPATAFAGIKLPVQIGDKVILHIADSDIQPLLFNMKTAGITDPGNAEPKIARRFHLSDSIAYTGFQSLDDIKYDENYKNDVWIFNNDDSDNYNHFRLRSDGGMEIKTLNGFSELTKDGQWNLNAPANVTITAPTSTFNGNVVVTGTVDADGTITSATDCVSAGISGKLHTHPGVLSGGSNTLPPV
ncbi:MAG: hypothetical protein HRU21_10590 [Pseudomonadales bacterium]|nr:hypothetical protein [Pseudomonadales bacterium]